MEFENGVANFLRIKKETLKKDEQNKQMGFNK